MSWQQTYTGKAFTALDPKPEDVCIEDIAHALALQCRFAGHCRFHYSVAQHSVLASYEINKLLVASEVSDRDLSRTAFLHDAAEAYVIDVPSPIKPYLKGYEAIERGVQYAVAAKFKIDVKLFSHPLVKRVDLVMLATEKRDLMGPEPRPWIEMPPPSQEKITPWSHEHAERRFLERFQELFS